MIRSAGQIVERIARVVGLTAISTACAAQPGTPSAGSAARTTIVIPPNAIRQRLDSARLLQSYIREASGTEMPIGRAAPTALAIHVGRSDYVDSLQLKLDTLDGDGFVLKGIDAHNYVIAGPTEWGTEFGVYEFLERFLGVRWLLPGESGTDVPRSTSLKVTPEEVRQQPAFFSRLFSGLYGVRQFEWARRNRMRDRVAFHHNLYKLFPPSRYRVSRPDFYPIVDGKRYLPENDDDQNWQPNFSAPGIAEEAARNIVQYFRKSPEEDYYSLGVNDSGNYDESPESLARESKEPNFLGRRNVSDSYYRWCNDVAEKVLQTFPDKHFGCLAYSQVADAPKNIKLNPRIIPFMTYDRMRWCDPELRDMCHDVTSRWAAAATVLGWYDYAYGTC